MLMRLTSGVDGAVPRAGTARSVRRDTAKIFRVASDPARGMNNPYVDLFYDALEPHGITLCDHQLVASREWLKDNANAVGAVHFHWPEDCWRVRLRTLRQRIPWFFRLPALPGMLDTVLRVYRLSRFRGFLRAAKRARIHIIWTMHNLDDHDGSDVVDRYGCKLLIEAAELVICHSEDARRACLQRYRPRGQVVVMPHGNYDGAYPPPRPRDEVLRDLGLRPDLPVVCCLGGLRAYKGFDLACEALARFNGQVQLIIGGIPHRTFDLETLKRQAERLPGATLLARRLSEAELSDFVSASEVVLLPYRRMTTSGALLAALTLGRAVVASDLPFFREILSAEPDAGVLFEPGDAAGLARAIGAALEIPGARRTAASRRLADRYAWERVVPPVADVFRRWVVYDTVSE
jgi:beta-1,4-mannosyltransferase